MATSTIPTLKANLKAQLEARPGLSGVRVSYGSPLPNPGREYIWLGDASGGQDYAAFSSPNQRREEYRLQVIFSVLVEGTNQKAADDRCFVLAGELETQVRSDKTVNGAVEAAKLGGFQLTEFVSPDGMNRQAQLIFDLECGAWI